MEPTLGRHAGTVAAVLQAEDRGDVDRVCWTSSRLRQASGLPAGTGETGPLLRCDWLPGVEGADSETRTPEGGGGRCC